MPYRPRRFNDRHASQDSHAVGIANHISISKSTPLHHQSVGNGVSSSSRFSFDQGPTKLAAVSHSYSTAEFVVRTRSHDNRRPFSETRLDTGRGAIGDDHIRLAHEGVGVHWRVLVEVDVRSRRGNGRVPVANIMSRLVSFVGVGAHDQGIAKITAFLCNRCQRTGLPIEIVGPVKVQFGNLIPRRAEVRHENLPRISLDTAAQLLTTGESRVVALGMPGAI